MDTKEQGHQTPWTYTIASGKGGVGKTNIVLNLSLALKEAGRKVLILDADLGLGNLDVLLGIKPTRTLGDVILNRCSLREALIDGPRGVKILPADSGVEDFTRLNTGEKIHVFSLFHQLRKEADTILIDTASGISSNVLFFASFAHQVLLIATPEPTSITDAYATMKVLNRTNGEQNFQYMINLVESREQGREVYETLKVVSERFLKITPGYAGCILKDSNLTDSVLRQKPILDLHPDSQASRDIHLLAEKMLRENQKFLREEAVGARTGPFPVGGRNPVMVQ